MAARKRELEDDVKALAVEIANLRCQIEMLADAVQDARLHAIACQNGTECRNARTEE